VEASNVDRIRRSPVLVRVVRARPRLFTCGALGIAAGLIACLTSWRPATRMLTGWDIGVALYLILVFHMMWSSKIHTIRQRAAAQDEGRLTLLVLPVVAALASLVAIFAQLGSAAPTRESQPLKLVLPALTILLSWALIHTLFALHYAHEFYDETDSGGLAFPGDDREPDYWDFVYFSFVIGMTSQVSDVTISSKQIRRTVTAHGVVSFVFNAALLALTVNLAASAL
jgi:uncharacterized membrane protein